MSAVRVRPGEPVISVSCKSPHLAIHQRGTVDFKNCVSKSPSLVKLEGNNNGSDTREIGKKESFTWKLKPHNRDNYSTVQIPVTYDAKAKDPSRFIQFLKEIFAGDPDAEEKSFCVTTDVGSQETIK